MWQTRTLATFIAATVPVEKDGDVSPLLDAAKAIGEPAEDRHMTPSDRPGSVNEPAAGSYERFMSTFGSPARWAGR